MHIYVYTVHTFICIHIYVYTDRHVHICVFVYTRVYIVNQGKSREFLARNRNNFASPANENMNRAMIDNRSSDLKHSELLLHVTHSV